MSQNPLASYFTNSDHFLSSNHSATTDLAGRTFFDLISECKDFNERDLNTNDLIEDSYYDIWPIPEHLQQFVDKSDFTLDENQLFNTFAINDQLNDPIKQLVLKYFNTPEANKRQLPNAETVVPDANGLQILIKCGCFRSVINLTYKILKPIYDNNPENKSKSFYTPYILQIFFIRIAILMKLKLFKEAELELKQFKNFQLPHFFYEFQSKNYPNRKGSMIAFGLRMLNAELPQYLGRSDESITNLSELLKTVNEIILNKLDSKNEKALKVWHDRKHKIQFSIVNILINRKNYEKALEILEKISESEFSDKCALWSCIGKVYIQIGDIFDAGNAFVKAKSFSQAGSKPDQCRMLLNLSLIKIVNNLYNEAYECLAEAYTLMPDNSLILNNMAFCLFYSGNLKGAITLIEKHVHTNPRNNLNESLIFNLCTLYELESAKSQQKKLNLLLWLNVYVGDGFNESCIQLQ